MLYITLVLPLLLFFLIKYPFQTLIFVTLVTLENSLYLVQINHLILLPVLPGISLNFTDLLTISFIPIMIFTGRDISISPSIKWLLVFLAFSVFLICIASLGFGDVSLGLIGNRLRKYFVYIALPGLFTLIDGKKRFKFFLVAVYVIASTACIIQIIEFLRGQPFYIASGGVTNLGFERGMGYYENVLRIWNRAQVCTLFMLSTSLALILMKGKYKIISILPLLLATASTMLGLTRTSYIFGILSLATILLLNSFKQKSTILTFIMPFSLIAVVIGMTMFSGTHSNVGGAVHKRLLSIGDAFDRTKHTTMDDRKSQYDRIKKIMAESSIPPILGLGITDESVKLVTSDLGYINIFVNLGVLGLIFVLWWLAYLFFAALKIFRKSTEPLHIGLALGVLGSLPGIVVTGVNFDYFTGSLFLLPLIMTVVLESIRNIEKRTSLASLQPPSLQQGA